MATVLERQIKMGDDNQNPMHPKLFKVMKVRKETHDTFSLNLEASDGSGGFHFQPGQFNMLYLFGVGEAPISISGDPGVKKTLTHTIRAVGAVTKGMMKLKKGDSLGVRGPYGTTWPTKEAEGKDVVIIAGGIGLAPLRPVIYHLLSNREKFGKTVLLYGARTPDDLLYVQELEQWRSRFDFEVLVTVDRALGKWQGNIEVVTRLIPKATYDPANSIAMVCGPSIMMRFTVLELMKQGLTQNQIYISEERNMKCGIGHCGHCQIEHIFVCKDGPVFRYDAMVELFKKRDI
jgi:NAD(P)H-flavin reductase